MACQFLKRIFIRYSTFAITGSISLGTPKLASSFEDSAHVSHMFGCGVWWLSPFSGLLRPVLRRSKRYSLFNFRSMSMFNKYQHIILEQSFYIILQHQTHPLILTTEPSQWGRGAQMMRANNWRVTGCRRDEAYHLSMILYWREEHLQLPCAAIFVGKSIWTTHLWQLGFYTWNTGVTQKRMRFQKRHGFWENLNEFEVEVIQTFGCCWYDVSSWYIHFLDVSFQINSTSTEFCEVASAWIPQDLYR